MTADLFFDEHGLHDQLGNGGRLGWSFGNLLSRHLLLGYFKDTFTLLTLSRKP